MDIIECLLSMENINWIKKFIFVSVIVLLLWLLTFIGVCLWIKDWPERGQFGDLFGSINALFSGLAFAGMIITLHQQHEDLNYQRKSIEQTNEEMKRQTEEFDLQNQTLKRQQFDNTFFELLRMLQTITNNLVLDFDFYDEQSHKVMKMGCSGKNVFHELFIFRTHKTLIPNYDYLESLEVEIQEMNLNVVFGRYDMAFLYHYFLFIYRVVKFVDESKLLASYNDRYNYIAYLRSTLSNYETVVLYYYGLTDIGSKKFKPLAERYSLFKNLDFNLLVNNNDYNRYDRHAFIKHKPSLRVVVDFFKMRCVEEGFYQWQINLIAKAEFGGIYGFIIRLVNKRNFTKIGRDETNTLFLKRAIRKANFHIDNLDKNLFEKQVDQQFPIESIVIKEFGLGEDSIEYLTFADSTETIKLCDGYESMPREGWELKIDYNEGESLSIPLTLDTMKSGDGLPCYCNL